MSNDPYNIKQGQYVNKKNLDQSISLPSGSYPLTDIDIANMNASKLLGGANSNFLRWLAGVPTWINLALADIITALGFTPENIANKGTVNGYAPLDAGSKLPLVNLNTITSVQVDASIEKTANKGTANGYASLDANSNLIGNLATKSIDNTIVPTDGMVLTYDNASGKVKFKTSSSGSVSEIQFLASQAALGNLIEKSGSVVAVGVICTYTVPNGKTFTLYRANYAANNNAYKVQLRNNGVAIETRGFNVALAQVLTTDFVTRGDQLVGTGALAYDINNSVNGGAVSLEAGFMGYIA